METNAQLISKLKTLSKGQDFIDFSKRIIKTNLKIIGVPTLDIKKLAKTTPFCVFLDKPKYYEEVLLEGLVIAKTADFELFKLQMQDFFDKIDNWAVVDIVVPACKALSNNQRVFDYFCSLLKSKKEFEVRFAIVGLKKYFADISSFEQAFAIFNPSLCDYYYVCMAISWYISEILIKNPQNAVKNMQKIIKNNHFNSFIINTGIQKAVDSRRIDAKLKQQLRELKI